MNASVSAGGQFATGNSRLVAATGTGKFDMRRGDNAFAAAVIGNYSEAYSAPSATYVTDPMTGQTVQVPAAAPGWKESVENLQGKLRYDRYFSRNFSAFMQLTGTHDAFQAITFRLNLDPGVKYLFYNHPDAKIWGEAGYDFQYDLNYTDGNGIEQAGAGGAQTDPNGIDYLIQKSDTIHSGRLFAGFQHSFNKEVNLNFGLEYLQGFGGSGGGAPTITAGHQAFSPTATTYPAAALANGTIVDPVSITLTGSRLNMDILLAAKLGAGLSFGVGFNAKYNSAPLAGKENLDTSTTLTLIYAFSGKKEEPKPKEPPPCPCNTPPPGAATPAAGAPPPPPPPPHP
jgi:hypothetical protein